MLRKLVSSTANLTLMHFSTWNYNRERISQAKYVMKSWFQFVSTVTNRGPGYGFPVVEQPFEFHTHQPNDGSSYFLSHDKVAAHDVVRVIHLQGSMLFACCSANRTPPWPVWPILKLSRRTQHRPSVALGSHLWLTVWYLLSRM